MFRFQNIYALKSKYTCFICADSCFLVRRLLELVAETIGIILRIRGNRFRIVYKIPFFNTKKSPVSLGNPFVNSF